MVKGATRFVFMMVVLESDITKRTNLQYRKKVFMSSWIDEERWFSDEDLVTDGCI